MPLPPGPRHPGRPLGGLPRRLEGERVRRAAARVPRGGGACSACGALRDATPGSGRRRPVRATRRRRERARRRGCRRARCRRRRRSSAGSSPRATRACATTSGVSTPELDALVEELVAAGAAGARLTGAGFGGCAVATVEADRVASSGRRDRRLPRPHRLRASRLRGARGRRRGRVRAVNVPPDLADRLARHGQEHLLRDVEQCRPERDALPRAAGGDRLGRARGARRAAAADRGRAGACRRAGRARAAAAPS